MTDCEDIKLKDNYEVKEFRRRFVVLSIIALLFLWWLAWYLGEKDARKASVMTGGVVVLALLLYFVTVQFLRSLYRDVDDISKVMLDVVEGKEDYHAEVYKQGSLGLLYTNFYKMVGVLRESQMKTRQEKEFLKETISDISHQLKTPLASLNVFMDLLYDNKIKEEAKKKEVLGEAKKQLSRMEWMVLAMLKLARIEAGSVQFEMKMRDAENIVKTAMEGVNYLVDKRGQKIVLEIQGRQQESVSRKMQILCDGEWLTEAIINLLKNASDYSGEGTIITVLLEDHELFTKIHVKDEGVGIPEEALPHIFKRFYRVDNSVNPGSVGIGLALSKSIVEGMQGKIKVKSEVGKYTCFTVTFLK